MTRFITFAAAAALGVAAAQPVGAEVGPCDKPNPPAWCVQTEVPGAPPGRSGEDREDGRPTGYAWYDIEISETADGELCWTYSVVYRSEPPPPQRTAEYVLPRVREWGTNVGGLDGCPAPEPAFDPGAAARVFWTGTDPTAATARVRPGKALTGLRAYLELDGPPELSASTDTPLGPLSISATPTYTIDWGDGTPATTTTSRGVPWPGGPGEITHVYTDAGEVTITVTTTWTAVWSLGGQGGGLPARSVSSALLLPVEQVQAVRSR